MCLLEIYCSVLLAKPGQIKQWIYNLKALSRVGIWVDSSNKTIDHPKKQTLSLWKWWPTQLLTEKSWLSPNAILNIFVLIFFCSWLSIYMLIRSKICCVMFLCMIIGYPKEKVGSHILGLHKKKVYFLYVGCFKIGS